MALPDLNLYDDDDLKRGWKWSDGLCGLVPGVSTLEDAEKLLGTAVAKTRLANGTTYDFDGGAIRATVIHGDQFICRITALPSLTAQHRIPRDIAEAKSTFGDLKATKVDRHEGVRFERPGMRIVCDPGISPETIIKIDVFMPEEDASSACADRV